MTRTSALRTLIDNGSPLTLQFNLRGGFADAANAVDTAATSAATTSNVGQVSVVGLKPYTLEQKFDMLKRMIARGEASLAPGVSLDTVKHEMGKPENDGLGVKDMATVLAMKKMLKFPSPKAQLKVAAPVLTPRF